MKTVIRYPDDAGKLYELFHYPGGEKQVRFTDERMRRKMRHSHEVKVVATIEDGEIMELALLTDAIQECTPTNVKLALILPYLPYARADRRFVKGDCCGLETFANLLNRLGYNQIISLDVHSDAYKKWMPTLEDVSPFPFILRTRQTIGGNTAIILPDKGALRYGLDGFVCRKVRDPKTGKLSGFVVPTDKDLADYNNVLIVDDICDGGGTFAGIAEKLPKRMNLFLYVTHGIFSKGFEPLKRFHIIFTTNSLPQKEREGLIVYPCVQDLIDFGERT